MHLSLKFHNILVVFIIFSGSFAVETSRSLNDMTSNYFEVDEALYLTKYIENGNIEMVCVFPRFEFLLIFDCLIQYR